MNRPLLFVCGVVMQLGIIPAVDAYSPKDLKTLIATNKCIGCDLSGANLSRKKLVNADLRAANLVGANLTNTNLTAAKLDGANLTGAILKNTNLSQAKLQAISAIDVNFANTNLTKTDLSYANLVNTNFRTAILQNTDLAGANLALADFTGANLSSTDLTSANLIGARGVTIAPSAPITPATPITPDTRDPAITTPRYRYKKSPPPTVDENGFRRPRIYRIPTGLGRPDRLIPGGTRHTGAPETDE